MGCKTKDLTLAASTASAAVLICTAPVLAQSADTDEIIVKNPNISPDEAASLKKQMTAQEFMDAEIKRLTELKQQQKAAAARRGNGNNGIIARGGGPANDTCATAEVISFVTGGENASTTVSGSTAGAADDYNQVCPFSNTGAADVVYEWLCDADGLLDINLCAGNTDYDSKVYVHADDCNVGASIACNDDACTSAAGQPFVSQINNIPVVAGTTYYITVDGWSAGDEGNFDMDLNFTVATPVPDTCEDAIDVLVAGGVEELPALISGDTSLANDDYNEVCPYTTTGAPDTVYSYTPTEDGFFAIDMCSFETDYDTKIYVYENVCGGTPIACDDDSCTSAANQPFVSQLSNVEVTAGNTYYIVVDGWSAADSGTYIMEVSLDNPPPPPPDCERDAGGAAAPYAQPASETGGTFSLAEAELGFQQVSRFDTDGGLNVTKIRFWGTTVEYDPLTGTLDGNAPCEAALVEEGGDPVRTFDVTIYDDLFGTPGAVRCEYLDAEAEVLNTDIRPLANFPDLFLIQYDIDLPTDCTTAGGWLGIDGGAELAGVDPICSFLWVTAPTNAIDVGSVTISGGAITENAAYRALCALGQRLGVGSFTGACCSEDPILPDPDNDDCFDGFNGGDCINQFAGEFFPFLECVDIECFVPQGACCTGDTGDPATEYLCLGVMSQPDCDLVAGDLVPPVADPSWLPETSCFECPIAPPPGDDCANPVIVTEGVTLMTTVGATLEAGESDGVSCTSGTGNNSVWASFTAPAGPAGIATFDTCGSALDTIMTLWDACEGVELDCNDDACGFQSVLTRSMSAGETVLIRITGWNSANGPFVLNVDYAVENACCTDTGCIVVEEADCTLAGGVYKPGVTDCALASCNDSCEDAEEIVGDLEAGVTLAPVTVNADTDGFNTDSSCWTSSGGTFAAWYTFTAPCDGLFDAITTVADDTEMLLFDITALGDCPTAGAAQQIAEGCDDNCVVGGFSACIQDAAITGGNTYALRISHFGGGTLDGSTLVDVLVHDCAVGGGPGDVNGDGCVDLDDLLDVIGGWGSTYGLSDLLDVIGNWGTGCTP